MSLKIYRTALLLGASVALPAAAQMSTPPGAPMMAGPGPGAPMSGGPEMHGQMFPSMSPAGRTIRWEARRGDDNKSDREAVKAARDKVLAVLDAPTLDVAALKRAMDEERAVVDAQQAERQAAMLAAFQKLTPADRKAFVTDARAMRDRMSARLQQKRGGWGQTPPPAPPVQ